MVARELGESVREWYVLHTKFKCEKFVRDRIRKMGMESFVPLIRRTARYQRKVKVYELPVISCYTFVRMCASEKNQVLAQPYVLGFLQFDGKLCRVSDQEMRWLQQVSGSDLPIST